MPDPVFALSLTDPYLHLEERDEVLRVTEEFTVNEDDVSCQLLVLKASAQRTQRRCPPSTEGDAEEQEAKRSASQRSRVHTWFGLRVRRQGRQGKAGVGANLRLRS